MAQVTGTARDYARKSMNLPVSTQVAIVTVLPNIVNGAFWGFTSVKEMKEYAEELKKDSNIQLRRIGHDAVIVEVDPNYLISATKSVGNELINEKDLQCMKDYSSKAVVEFEKFLLNKGKKGFAGLIGIYCTNDTTSITYKGTVYPAFRLPITKVLQLCNKFKYMVKVNGRWVAPQDAMKAGQALFDSMILSPTKTGVFLEIKSVATIDELRQLEAMMREGK